MTSVSLESFRTDDAGIVLNWVQFAEELYLWAGRSDFPLTDPTVFRQWHDDSEVEPFELLVDGAPIGYGEVWRDMIENSVELGRLIVAPELRRRGYGKSLVAHLVDFARASERDCAWVRVIPTNTAAQRCYEAAGFSRVSLAEEEQLNAGQPREYYWMRQPI